MEFLVFLILIPIVIWWGRKLRKISEKSVTEIKKILGNYEHPGFIVILARDHRQAMRFITWHSQSPNGKPIKLYRYAAQVSSLRGYRPPTQIVEIAGWEETRRLEVIDTFREELYFWHAKGYDVLQYHEGVHGFFFVPAEGAEV